jgi:hypothetical protein
LDAIDFRQQVLYRLEEGVLIIKGLIIGKMWTAIADEIIWSKLRTQF